MPKIKVFTDGCCTPNPGRGGWGAVLLGPAKMKTIYGGRDNTTNNEMELLAVLKALEDVPENSELLVYTDSQMVHGFLEKSWNCRAKGLIPILVSIRKAIYEKHLNVKIEWIRGGQGAISEESQYNELADDLSHMGRQS